MKLLMRLVLFLYPSAWRKRYGAEINQLINDGRTSRADLVDLVAHVPIRSTIQGEASTMTRYLSAHPVAAGSIAFLVMIPSAALVAGSLLKYIGGISAPFDAIEPAMTPLLASPMGDKLLLLAPCAAFALAILPFARLRVGRRHGRLAASGEVALPFLNVAVGLVAAALVAIMGLYGLAENL
ncbi:MAG TPA: hypothetical protein VM427_04190 [Patescibacteria group bacterium]|nr:hypothetical protein [Patescibacteria group bacterium]